MKATAAIVTAPETLIERQVQQARAIIEKLQPGDTDALIQATLLQGVASGDIIAAAVAQKLRLQRENLRLKARLARTKLRIEAAKLRLIERRGKKVPTSELNNAIKEIYGLK